MKTDETRHHDALENLIKKSYIPKDSQIPDLSPWVLDSITNILSGIYNPGL